MPEQILRPVFTPDDAREVAARAAEHTPERGESVEPIAYISCGAFRPSSYSGRAQYRRPRTRVGRAVRRVLGAWWIWTILAGLIVGAALYFSVPAHAEPVCPGDAGYGITEATCDGPPAPDGTHIRCHTWGFFGAHEAKCFVVQTPVVLR